MSSDLLLLVFNDALVDLVYQLDEDCGGLYLFQPLVLSVMLSVMLSATDDVLLSLDVDLLLFQEISVLLVIPDPLVFIDALLLVSDQLDEEGDLYLFQLLLGFDLLVMTFELSIPVEQVFREVTDGSTLVTDLFVLLLSMTDSFVASI